MKHRESVLKRCINTARYCARLPRTLTPVSAAASVLILAAACSSSGSPRHTASSAQTAATGATSTTAASSARALLPTSIKSSGVLTVADALNYPPYDFLTASGEPTGIDVDLLQAMATFLGLKTKYQNIDFSSLITSVANGRFDVAQNEFYDIPKRRLQVTFIDTYTAYDSLLVPAGNPKNLSPETLCGHSISLLVGSVEISEVSALSATCVSSGKKSITQIPFQSSSAQYLAVTNGRADAAVIGAATAAYVAAHSGGKLQALSSQIPNSLHTVGTVVAKTNQGLAKALQSALNALIASGKYAQILQEWNVSGTALKHATINQGSD